MGIISQGILGALRKKVGSVVGASWKGIPVLRIYQPVVANPKTAAQVRVRSGFKAFGQLASLILASYIKPLWDRGAVRMSGYNAFLKANALSISGNLSPYDTHFIATKGKMDATTIATAAVSPAAIVVTWDPTEKSRYALDSDLPFVLVVNSTNDNVMFAGQAPEGTTREDGTLSIPAASFLNGSTGNDAVCVYLSFMRADGTIVSDSAFKDAIVGA